MPAASGCYPTDQPSLTGCIRFVSTTLAPAIELLVQAVRCLLLQHNKWSRPNLDSLVGTCQQVTFASSEALDMAWAPPRHGAIIPGIAIRLREDLRGLEQSRDVLNETAEGGTAEGGTVHVTFSRRG